MSNLEKKNIIVTGASGGIGNAIIKKLSEAGANILASGTRIEKLEERLEKLEDKEKKRYKEGEKEIRVYFKNGFKMRTLDNSFKFQAGGRIMHDWGFFSEDQKYLTNHGAQENGARFRRVRLFMAGMLYKTIKFKWDIDCLLYTSPSPRDRSLSRMPSSA